MGDNFVNLPISVEKAYNQKYFEDVCHLKVKRRFHNSQTKITITDAQQPTTTVVGGKHKQKNVNIDLLNFWQNTEFAQRLPSPLPPQKLLQYVFGKNKGQNKTTTEAAEVEVEEATTTPIPVSVDRLMSKQTHTTIQPPFFNDESPSTVPTPSFASENINNDDVFSAVMSPPLSQQAKAEQTSTNSATTCQSGTI